MAGNERQVGDNLKKKERKKSKTKEFTRKSTLTGWLRKGSFWSTGKAEEEEVDGYDQGFASPMSDLKNASKGATGPENGDYSCEVLNSTFTDNLGMSWEIVLMYSTGQETDETSKMIATNVNPPLRVNKVTKIRLPRLGIGSKQVVRWKLSLRAPGLSFPGGVTEIDVTPGQRYVVSMAANSNPINLEQYQLIQNCAIQFFGKHQYRDGLWSDIGAHLHRGEADIKRAFKEAQATVVGFRPWLTLHHHPKPHGVSKAEILQVLKKRFFAMEIYWRRVEPTNEADLITVKYAFRFGENEGVTVSTFRNNHQEGKHFIAGPFDPTSFKGKKMKSIASKLVTPIKNVLKSEAPKFGDSMVYHSAIKVPLEWDSLEILVFANPHALLEFEDVITESGLRKSFGTDWPLVLRTHQYNPPETAEAPKPLPFEAAVCEAGASLSSFVGIGTPDELISGLSSAGNDIKKQGEQPVDDDINWGTIQPLFLHWQT